MHTHTHTRVYSLHKTQLKWTTDLRQRKTPDTSAEQKTWQVHCFGRRNNALRFDLKGVQRGFLSKWKGKVIPCRGAEDRKGAGTNLLEGKGKVIQCTDVVGLKTEKAQESTVQSLV